METVENESPEARSNTDRAFFIYQRIVSLFLPILIGVTYPIWFPQSQFPAVPVWHFLSPVPGLVDAVLAGLLLAISVTLLITGPRVKPASMLWLSLAVLLSVSFLLNQHRFQPWAYQFALLATFFALAPASIARRLASWLALSVYFYSALSKLNPSFISELGADFLSTIATFGGLTLDAGQQEHWKWLALVFPAFELLAFVLLLSPVTRKLGVIAACTMHIGLLMVLGPLGLNHSWGVLLWNVFFIAQAILLFWLPAPPPETSIVDWKARSAQVICWIALLFPTLEVIGIGDPWPAWGLYASHVGRTHCFIVRHAAKSLPEDLRSYVDTESSNDLFIPIDLGRWSIETTGAPIYPGERFSFAVGRSFVMKTEMKKMTLFVVESPAGRIQDDRDTSKISGEELAGESNQRFWLNTLPRDYYLKD